MGTSEQHQTPAGQLRGGANQSGVRAYNERLLMSLLQRNGPTPGIDLARQTGLSAQTVSVILRKLEKDGLLQKGPIQKGKVGKPSVPMGLNPKGILSFGFKIGRRTADLVLLDVSGKIYGQRQLRYDVPTPPEILTFLERALGELSEQTPQSLHSRICGLGVAMPFEIWNWGPKFGASEDALAGWKSLDFAASVGAFCTLPLRVTNDTTAACRAEHTFGDGKAFRDYAYFYLGAFVGGGVVMNDSVVEGNRRNAGALGSLPTTNAQGERCQLLDLASLRQLEQRLQASGGDPQRLWQRPLDWGSFASHTEEWVETCALELTRASQAVCAVIDFDAILIDGAMPDSVKQDLVDRIRQHVQDMHAPGLLSPEVHAGKVGIDARAIGAAAGPIVNQFLLDRTAAPLAGN
ncbi:MAG: ROK family transcriptional regulator [Thalassovita sp.]